MNIPLGRFALQRYIGPVPPDPAPKPSVTFTAAALENRLINRQIEKKAAAKKRAAQAKPVRHRAVRVAKLPKPAKPEAVKRESRPHWFPNDKATCTHSDGWWDHGSNRGNPRVQCRNCGLTKTGEGRKPGYPKIDKAVCTHPDGFKKFGMQIGRQRWRCRNCKFSKVDEPMKRGYATRFHPMDPKTCTHPNGWRKAGMKNGKQRFKCKNCKTATCNPETVSIGAAELPGTMPNHPIGAIAECSGIPYPPKSCCDSLQPDSERNTKSNSSPLRNGAKGV